MKQLIAYVVLLLWAGTSHAEPIFGQDYLASQHPKFKVEAATKFLPKGHALGSLYNTFGNGVANDDALIGRVAPTYFRVHLINGPCIRNKNCGSYEVGYGYNIQSFSKAVENGNPKILKYVETGATAYKALAEKHTGTTFVVSPELEHDLSPAAWRRLADTVRRVWPNVQLANSPDGGIKAERYLGAWIERHGSTKISDADIVSTDGVHSDLIDVDDLMARTKKAKIVYWWTGAYNCRVPTWQDPRDRKECPTEQMFELMAHLQDSYPAPVINAPASCKKIFPLKAPTIWKVFAENHGNGDARANKPVFISKVFGKGAVVIMDTKGTKIGSLGYYSNYLDQGNRYYSAFKGGTGDSAYGIHKKAVAGASSPYVWASQGGVCQGPFIAAKRQGLMKG